MADLDFIAKTPRLEKSQDYAFLRSAGLEHVERLAHDVWTDYNVHDPGITFLELLCYGITELGYRTGYGIRDLLTGIDDGVAVNHGDFHTAREVLTSGPVSSDDLRKLLIDVQGVKNAWLEPHTSIRYLLDSREKALVDPEDRPPGEELIENDPLSGLYDVFVEYDDDVEEEPRLVTVGLPDVAAGAGDYLQVGYRGLRFDADWEFVLVAVDVYPQAAGRVGLRLVDAAGQVLATAQADVDRPGEANRVELGFRVPPGEGYRLEAVGPETTVPLYRTLDPSYPYVHEGVLRIVSGSSGSQVIQPYSFFYAWRITYAAPPRPRGSRPEEKGLPPGLQQPKPPRPETVTRDDVRLAVTERLHAYRNLCEDFVNVAELETEKIALCTDLDLWPDADVEAVLAAIFDRVGRHVSPEIRFYTLEEMLERGKPPDEIFAGPPLDHGFIDDDEFRRMRRRCEIRASDVMKILMDVDGVKAIRSLSLLAFLDGADEPRAQEEWVLPLSTDRFRSPVFAHERSKIIFYKNGLPYFASRSRVAELVTTRRAEELRSKLRGESQDLPVPAGAFREPEVYVPLQNELPKTYGVGQVRIPASRPPLRKAQAKQLKAYLLFFEQLLANQLSQLAHVKELFSWRDGGTATYFTQAVTGIADLEEIYNQELLAAEYGGSLETALAAIIEDDETAAERRNRFLDHLLARFAEDLTEYGRLMEGLVDDARKRVSGDKRELLADYLRVGRYRGQGYDVRRPDDADNLVGYARRVYRLLGIRGASYRELAGHRIEIEEVFEDDGTSRWRFVLLNGAEEKMEEDDDDGEGEGHGEGEGKGHDKGKGEGHDKGEGEGHDHDGDDEDEDDTGDGEDSGGGGSEYLFESGTCESASAVEVLIDFVLSFGGERHRYRPAEDQEGWELIRECPGQEPQVLGTAPSAAARDQAADYFRQHGDGAEGFHVIEHLLLRKRTTGDPYMPVQLDDPGRCECIQVRDPYTFRATVLLPSWPTRFRGLKFRRLVEDTLRREAPAHVYLKICWISHRQMKQFETVYDAWRRQLAALSAAPAPLTGELPLPPTGPEHAAYGEALDTLIDKLHSLITVHPLARLHDCEETTGDAPQVTLNNTSLGTF